MKILLIAGGWSSEREISLKGAAVIQKALATMGHTVTAIDLLTEFDNLINLAQTHDFAFINLHGRPGEDGLVQAMLDSCNCPYQGSGPASSFLALNKAAAKQIFRISGLPTADWEFLPIPPEQGWQPRLGYPLFAKSNTGGSSLHLGKVENREELDSIMSEIFAVGDSVLLEQALSGYELTCGVLGDRALPPVLIEPEMGKFFNFTSKYNDGGAKEICPAPIEEPLSRKIQELALAAHRAVGLSGVSRTDIIVSPDGVPSILEVNTIPGMTTASLIPKEASAIGLSFEGLLESLIAYGYSKGK